MAEVRSWTITNRLKPHWAQEERVSGPAAISVNVIEAEPVVEALRGVREAITAYDADEATEDELIDHIEASLRPLTELERTDP
jgi:hypothetical protein